MEFHCSRGIKLLPFLPRTSSLYACPLQWCSELQRSWVGFESCPYCCGQHRYEAVEPISITQISKETREDAMVTIENTHLFEQIKVQLAGRWYQHKNGGCRVGGVGVMGICEGGGVLSATAKHRPARSWLEALNERRVNWWVDGKNRLKAA